MAILFGVVARDTSVLAKHAVCPGNFVEVTEQVLAKIDTSADDKLTYSHGRYLFHYVCVGGVVFACITDDEFERSRAFAFLNDVRARFGTTYGTRARAALPYAMNSDFAPVLAAQMKAYSAPSPAAAAAAADGRATRAGAQGSYGSVATPGARGQRVVEMQTQVEDLKQIMVRNIDTLADRGEKLELLIDRSHNLETGAVSFRTRSHNLARTMCWKNVKITVCLAVLILVILFIIISASCGGLTFPNC